MATTTKSGARRGSEGGRTSKSRTEKPANERGASRQRRGSGSGGSASRNESPRITAKNLDSNDRKWLEKNAASLSSSTLRAKWIHSRDEHEDRPGQTLATRDPEAIKAWAEARGAEPATVARKDGARARTLRFDFPNFGGRTLEHIAWDEWLGVFQERDLVFIYQEHKRDRNDSNFFRLDNPKRQDG
jgi:hypothetical protein